MTALEGARAARSQIDDRLATNRLGRSLIREMDRDMLTLRAAGDAIDKVIAGAQTLIRDLTDPDDCWFDHNGGCQAHGYLSLGPGELCPHEEAKRDWGAR